MLYNMPGNQTIKELIHSRLISRDYMVNALKAKVASKDVHKSIIMYTVKILQDREFMRDPVSYLENMCKMCGEYADVPLEQVTMSKYQKIKGAHRLVSDLLAMSNGSYNI